MIISSLIGQIASNIDSQTVLLFQQLVILMVIAKFVDIKF